MIDKLCEDIKNYGIEKCGSPYNVEGAKDIRKLRKL